MFKIYVCILPFIFFLHPGALWKAIKAFILYREKGFLCTSLLSLHTLLNIKAENLKPVKRRKQKNMSFKIFCFHVSPWLKIFSSFIFKYFLVILKIISSVSYSLYIYFFPYVFLNSFQTWNGFDCCINQLGIFFNAEIGIRKRYLFNFSD